MIVVNFFGGPGVGKSTLATDLFSSMKKSRYKVELVTEFAKELVYAEDFTRLRDQILMFAEQNHRLKRLKGEVDFVITDSPLLNGIIYNNSVDRDVFDPLVERVFKSYNNINFFIERDDNRYQKYGRIHSLQEAKEIDKKILDVLRDYRYYKIKDIDDIDIEHFRKLIKS